MDDSIFTSKDVAPEDEKPAIGVTNILSPDRIVFLERANKIDSLTCLAQRLASAPQVKNAPELLAEILKREKLMSTAIGHGLAIPHVCIASVSDLVMAVGISRNAITDFQLIDDSPVHFVIMIAAAANQHSYYLRTLSHFSARLKDTALRSALLDAQTPSEAFGLLVSAFTVA
jgi:PTS system nitrogen regulatory IIA component